MKIEAFSARVEECGSLDVGLTLSVLTPAQERVHLIRATAVYADGGGFPLSCDTHLEQLSETGAPSGHTDVHVVMPHGVVPPQVRKQPHAQITALCSATLFTGELFRFEDARLPADFGGRVPLLLDTPCSHVLDAPLKATARLVRGDGDLALVACDICVTNCSTTFLSIVRASASVVPSGERDSRCTFSEDGALPGKTTSCISAWSDFRPIDELLRGVLRLQLTAFKPVHSDFCSARLSVSR